MPVKNLPNVGRRTQAVAALAALIALIAGLAFLTGPGNELNAAPKNKAVVLGAANAKRIPLCPDRCSGLAIVSGIQAKAGGHASAFRVPFVGNVTRWKISLGKPDAGQRAFFQTRFGKLPQAAIGVLAKKVVAGQVTYKLRSRTAIQGLNRYLGETATFTPAKPLKVNKGDLVALIVPTWAPALSQPNACSVINTQGDVKDPAACDAFNKNNSWIASRSRAQCLDASGNPRPINMKNSQPQTQVDSMMPYACRFNGALTYQVRVESR